MGLERLAGGVADSQRKDVDSVRCGELRKRTLQCLESGHSVETAARRMRDHAVDLLAICHRKGHLVGTLSAAEITTRVTAESRAAELCSVDEVMTKPPLVCRADDDWASAERLMRDQVQSRIVVVDDAGRPLGTLSLYEQPEPTTTASLARPAARAGGRFPASNGGTARFDPRG